MPDLTHLSEAAREILSCLKSSSVGLTTEKLLEKVADIGCEDGEIEKCLEELIEMGLARFDAHPAPGRFKATKAAFV